MALNKDAFINNYLDELEENLSAVDRDILTLKKDPNKEEALTSLLRSLHTIKGSSRMLKFNVIEAVSHGLENVFKGVKEGRYGISKNLIQLVLITTDYMRRGAKEIRMRKSDAIEVKKLLAVFERAYANEPYEVESVRLQEWEPPRKETEEHPDALQMAASKNGGQSYTPPSAAPTETDAQKALAGTKEKEKLSADRIREKSHETIRINVGRIENIVKLLNNLIIKQFQFRKEKRIVEELEEKMRDLLQGESTGGGRNGHSCNETCPTAEKRVRRRVSLARTGYIRTAGGNSIPAYASPRAYSRQYWYHGGRDRVVTRKGDRVFHIWHRYSPR